MSASMNQAILCGNIGRDPEIRHTNNGTAVLSLSVATNDRIKRGEEWVDDVQWHTVVLFGKRAEVVAEHAKKGYTVLVRGRIVTRKWQDKDGNNRYSTEILADEVNIFPREGGGGRPRQQERREEPSSDEDIPF